MSLHFFSPSSLGTKLACTAHTPQVLQMCLCERASVRSWRLPLKGLFWISVGAVQVLHLLVKAHTLYSHTQNAGDVCGLVFLVRLFCRCFVCTVPGKENIDISGFQPFWPSHKLTITVGEHMFLFFLFFFALTLLILTPSFPLRLRAYSHVHAATHRAMTHWSVVPTCSCLE